MREYRTKSFLQSMSLIGHKTYFIRGNLTGYHYLYFSHGINFNVQGYADAISRINEITLSVKSTYKIPIIYG